MTCDPDRAAGILHDGIDVAFGQAIRRRELSGGAIDDLRHATNGAEPDPQTAVARGKNGGDAFVG